MDDVFKADDSIKAISGTLSNSAMDDEKIIPRTASNINPGEINHLKTEEEDSKKI